MKTAPVVPAEIDFEAGADGVPFAPLYGDRYHARAGAFEQAQHVFLAGNGLPERWRGRARFVVLETGFGLGNNFLATWQAWRGDAQRSERLDYVAIEQHPPRAADLRRAHAASPAPPLAAELIAQWPPLTPNLHLLSLADGRVRLHLAFGDARDWLPELLLRFDACYLDGFAPSANPELWDPRLLKAIGRLAAPGATAATWSSARVVRDGLATAGFEVAKVPGYAGKRSMTFARHAPRHVPPPLPGRPRFDAPPRAPVMVIGAGLAGAAAARALARQGIGSLVLDAADAPAQHASGNPAGLFHGTLHREDGVHARWHRAAALAAAAQLRAPLSDATLIGRIDGLLRVETQLDRPAMDALVDRWRLPDTYVQVLEADAAAARAGLALAAPGWLYPSGGWVDPAGWVRLQLQHPAIELRCGVEVAALQADPRGWAACDRSGRAIAVAEHVVLAAGSGLDRFAGDLELPLSTVRGQITRIPPGMLERAPRLPVSGNGYAVALPDGSVLCGASSDPGDTDQALRAADTAYNLERARRLGISTAANPDGLPGRVAWRVVTPDRLPAIGLLPAPADPASSVSATSGRAAEPARARPQRLDQARFVPRRAGLWALGALGSRGIASAALGGELLAAWIAGAPLPIEASLLDAIDPARGRVRRARRSAC